MPKNLQIDPQQTYTADTVRFADIPVHAYAPDIAAERADGVTGRCARRFGICW